MTNREVFNNMSNEAIAPAFIYCVGDMWFVNRPMSDEAFDTPEEACEAVVKFFEAEFVE